MDVTSASLDRRRALKVAGILLVGLLSTASLVSCSVAFWQKFILYMGLEFVDPSVKTEKKVVDGIVYSKSTRKSGDVLYFAETRSSGKPAREPKSVFAPDTTADMLQTFDKALTAGSTTGEVWLGGNDTGTGNKGKGRSGGGGSRGGGGGKSH